MELENLTNFFTKNRKGIKIAFLIVSAFALITLGIATFYDYDISVSLVNTESKFGKFFKNYGELPAYLSVMLFFLCIGRLKEHDENKCKSIIYLICGVIASFVMFLFVLKIENNLQLLYPLLFFGICYALSFLIQREFFQKLTFLFMIMAFLMTFSSLTILLIKVYFGRMRYYDLTGEVDFTRWFMPQGITGHQSFPSGHTTAAASTFALMLIPLIFEIKNKVVAITIVVLPFVYTSIVAISRIILGAHYLSDVIAAFYISFGWFFLIINYLMRYHKRKMKI